MPYPKIDAETVRLVSMVRAQFDRAENEGGVLPNIESVAHYVQALTDRLTPDFQLHSTPTWLDERRVKLDVVTCGTCGRSWDDALGSSWTPAPSGRCPFEYDHVDTERIADVIDRAKNDGDEDTDVYLSEILALVG